MLVGADPNPLLMPKLYTALISSANIYSYGINFLYISWVPSYQQPFQQDQTDF